MKIRAYLEWSQTATASDRADAVGILARICLSGELSPEERRDAVAALTLALDDPSPLVKMSLAQAVAAADTVPRHLIAALIDHGHDVAAVVLANSPMLTDAELVDALAVGGESAQRAVAGRPYLSVGVAAALAEVGSAEAIGELLANPGAEIPEFSLHRMVERHGEDGALREALLARGDLPAEIRLKLALTATLSLSSFAVKAGWLTDQRARRLSQDCRDEAAVAVAAETDVSEMETLVACLAENRSLTPHFLLRALMCGEVPVFAAALATLSDTDYGKALGIVGNRHRFAFEALCRKAGLPDALEPVFAHALHAVGEERKNPLSAIEPGRLSRRIVERTLALVAAASPEVQAAALPALTRLQAEAFRAEARNLVADILAEPALPPPAEEPADLEERLEEALALEFQQAA